MVFKLLKGNFVFAGSVFLTSGKFVDETNTLKFYSFILSLLALLIFWGLAKNSINFCAIKSKTTLWGFNVIIALQAVYALLQFVGWFPSNHSKFAVTGSFDNPAGFAAILSVGFPIGLILLAKANKIERYFAGVGVMIIAIAVLLSGTRAGIMAILISTVVFFLFQTNIISRVKQFRYHKLLSALALFILFIGIFNFYYLKKDSANGRLLIWRISSEMIREQPIFGHGYGSFKAKYMDFQAEYFQDNQNSKYELLADNVKHPFNEFIKITVEFGLIGLITFLTLILFILWKILKTNVEEKAIAFSGITSFLVFASFSYPLQYVAVWLLIGFYLSVLLPGKAIEIKNTSNSIIARATIVTVCSISIFFTFNQMQNEMKWKTIAMTSLQGNTEKMLPEYEKLYSTSLRRNPYFLYNFGAELNVAGNYGKSIAILNECKKHFNDYDLQMLLADNYYKNGETENSIQTYQQASNMIPCRFLPIYQLFEIYKKAKREDLAKKNAQEIIRKQVKISSATVDFIIEEAEEYLNN